MAALVELVAVPESDAVMVPAEKLPEPSRATSVLTVLAVATPVPEDTPLIVGVVRTGDVSVLFVNVSVPAKVASVPVTGSVTFVVVAPDVSAMPAGPAVENAALVETGPPKKRVVSTSATCKFSVRFAVMLLLVASRRSKAPLPEERRPRVATADSVDPLIEGLVPKTSAPLPVSSEMTPESWDEVVDEKAERLFEV